MSSRSAPAQALRKVPFLNESGEPIPSCAVMQITGSVEEDGATLLRCKKPSTDFGTQYAVNGPVVVPTGKPGICYRSGELPVAFDDGVPLAGEGWGPKPGQWRLSQGYPGWTIVGIVSLSSKIALVQLD
jgi:hypothetical protein